MKNHPDVGAADFGRSQSSLAVCGWRSGAWPVQGEWISMDAHLRAEREVRLARRLQAESWLERLTR